MNELKSILEIESRIATLTAELNRLEGERDKLLNQLTDNTGAAPALIRLAS